MVKKKNYPRQIFTIPTHLSHIMPLCCGQENGSTECRIYKEVSMKRILVGFLLGFMVLVFASHDASAQTCGCSDGPGKGFRGEGMPMMSPMQHHGRGMMGKERHLWGALKGLGLDENQKEAVREIKSRVMKDAIRKRADLEVARIDLRDLLHKDTVDMNAAETALKKIASLQTDIRLSHIKALEEIKAKLTPEQRKKLKEMREKGPRTERMKHDGMRMSPPTAKKEGALQDKEQ
jgi:Spy/CpxP family protein refolding chaperone